MFIQLVQSSLETLKARYVNYILWEKEVCNDRKQWLKKLEKETSVHLILEDIVRDWPYFRFHHLIKVKQDEAFNSLHTRIDPKSMLLQFDFSENAEITEQDEVQTAHWWHLQVTLFTAVAWVAGEKNCFAIISDYCVTIIIW